MGDRQGSVGTDRGERGEQTGSRVGRVRDGQGGT